MELIDDTLFWKTFDDCQAAEIPADFIEFLNESSLEGLMSEDVSSEFYEGLQQWAPNFSSGIEETSVISAKAAHAMQGAIPLFRSGLKEDKAALMLPLIALSKMYGQSLGTVLQRGQVRVESDTCLDAFKQLLQVQKPEIGSLRPPQLDLEKRLQDAWENRSYGNLGTMLQHNAGHSILLPLPFSTGANLVATVDPSWWCSFADTRGFSAVSTLLVDALDADASRAITEVETVRPSWLTFALLHNFLLMKSIPDSIVPLLVEMANHDLAGFAYFDPVYYTRMESIAEQWGRALGQLTADQRERLLDLSPLSNRSYNVDGAIKIRCQVLQALDTVLTESEVQEYSEYIYGRWLDWITDEIADENRQPYDYRTTYFCDVNNGAAKRYSTREEIDKYFEQTFEDASTTRWFATDRDLLHHRSGIVVRLLLGVEVCNAHSRLPFDDNDRHEEFCRRLEQELYCSQVQGIAEHVNMLKAAIKHLHTMKNVDLS